jgi:hypothetical protein
LRDLSRRYYARLRGNGDGNIRPAPNTPLEKIAFLFNAPKQRERMVETALENGLLAPYGAPQAIAGAISERYFGFYYYEPWAREHPQDARATEVMVTLATYLVPASAAVKAEAAALEGVAAARAGGAMNVLRGTGVAEHAIAKGARPRGTGLGSYWQRLTGHAPERSVPYDVIRRYDQGGNITGATTYDRFGNRAFQYEFGEGVRHGPGYHTYDNTGRFAGWGSGPRSPHQAWSSE